MRSPHFYPNSAVVTAMACAATVTAQFVVGKAARDALFLAEIGIGALPLMIVATAVVSIALVAVSSRALRYVAPGIFVPLAFVVSAVLLFVEWGLAYTAPRIAAPLVYLHISGLGPMLGSGFWLIATEHFDPRTAKKRFGQIAGMGTLGGLVGGLGAERLATVADVATTLPILAVLNLVCAWQVRRLAQPLDATASDPERLAELSPELAPAAPRSGLHVLAQAPYLRNLAALVMLGTMAAALVDYVFKAHAAATFADSDDLLRFFAIFYAAVGVVTFVVQTAGSRLALEKLGLAITTGTPSLALVFGGVAAWFVPGLESAMAARGGEAVFRASLFRSGYELFYTPIPSQEKRAAKSLIDVGFDRLGDALGGGAIRLVLMAAPANPFPAILALAMGCSAAALVAASRLTRGYVQTLERSLLHRAVELDLSDVRDLTTRTTMMRSLTSLRRLQKTRTTAVEAGDGTEDGPARARAGPSSVVAGLDPEMLQILALRSRDRERIRRVLHGDEPLPAVFVPHVIPLLAWDPVAEDALRALRSVADDHVGELVDALIDPNQDFAIRRRLARVFTVCQSQRAVDGLLLGLDDTRFEVRYQCARSLAAVLQRNPRVRIDPPLVFEVVEREVAVGRPVWESNRLLHRLESNDQNVFADEFVKDRAGRSLAHVFTLLSLVFPAETLQIAFRGLHSSDRNLRGTALEYLESVLPPAIRERLWPFLEDPRPAGRSTRPREEILADLVRSNESIMLNLEALRQQAGRKPRTP
jgi:hypothetical protein